MSNTIRKNGMQRVESFDEDKWTSCCGSNRPNSASLEKKDVINCLIETTIHTC